MKGVRKIKNLIGVCPICGSSVANITYRGVQMCNDCYIKMKIQNNLFENHDLEDNTFLVKKNDNNYVGLITGYQHKTGTKQNDKFYVYLNVNEEDFSIWYNSWVTEEELVQRCEKYKINVDELIK